MAETNPNTDDPTLSGSDARRLQLAVYDMELLFIAMEALPAVGTMGTRLGDDSVNAVVVRALCREGRELSTVAGDILDNAGFFSETWQKESIALEGDVNG